MRTTNEVIHKSFTIERAYSCSPSRVFSAFSDVTKKRRWFAEGPEFVVDSYELDSRLGGFEKTRFRFGDGPEMTLDGNDGSGGRREGTGELLAALERELESDA